MHAMHQTLHAVQGKVGTLECAAGPAAEPTFGPALSDLIDADPHCATTAVAIKRLHDGSAIYITGMPGFDARPNVLSAAKRVVLSRFASQPTATSPM
jgi:hypothetical protein